MIIILWLVNTLYVPLGKIYKNAENKSVFNFTMFFISREIVVRTM